MMALRPPMIIEVAKIHSYQTLVYKNGYKTFRKPKYNDYTREIGLQLLTMPKHTGNVSVALTFNSNTKAIGDIDNITKPILDVLQSYGIIDNDRHVQHLCVRKIFGSKHNTIEIEVKSIEQ
jgi:Holliday junction resolvase RusA-like endonuclease